METGELGKVFRDGEVIIRQGEKGDCMYVVQDGYVEVIRETEQGEVQLAVRGKGDFFGEMAIFESEVRMATVRALGAVRVMTIDRRNFMRRIQEDPSMAFRLVQAMSTRIRSLSYQIVELKMSPAAEA